MTRIVLANPSNKYGAKRTEYNGRIYHSKKEADYAAELDLRVRARDIKDWVPQVPFKMVVNGELICTYIMDFVLTHIDGTTELVEIKGKVTDTYRLKAKLLHALYPELRYTVIR